jgi:hypothetical protein
LNLRRRRRDEEMARGEGGGGGGTPQRAIFSMQTVGFHGKGCQM